MENHIEPDLTSESESVSLEGLTERGAVLKTDVEEPVRALETPGELYDELGVHIAQLDQQLPPALRMLVNG